MQVKKLSVQNDYQVYIKERNDEVNSEWLRKRWLEKAGCHLGKSPNRIPGEEKHTIIKDGNCNSYQNLNRQRRAKYFWETILVCFFPAAQESQSSLGGCFGHRHTISSPQTDNKFNPYYYELPNIIIWKK